MNLHLEGYSTSTQEFPNLNSVKQPVFIMTIWFLLNIFLLNLFLLNIFSYILKCNSENVSDTNSSLAYGNAAELSWLAKPLSECGRRILEDSQNGALPVNKTLLA